VLSLINLAYKSSSSRRGKQPPPGGETPTGLVFYLIFSVCEALGDSREARKYKDMGASASTLDQHDSASFGAFLKMKVIYETDYELKIASGEMTESDAYTAMSAQFEELVETSKKHQILMREKSRTIGDIVNVGDVVTATDKDGKEVEGVVIALHYEDDSVSVDNGATVSEFPLKDVTVKFSGDEIEMGDKVEVPDGGLFVTGIVIAVSDDKKTIDVQMDGDDPEDKELGVPRDKVRKVRTGRQLACMRWNKATTAIKSMRAFMKAGLGSVLKNHAADVSAIESVPSEEEASAP
jgi:hypothetical protein